MADVLQHPRVEMLATTALRPNPRNARTHSDKQISQIAASIERFGFLVPIIIDGQNLIAAGHGRWLAAKQLKLASVPAIRADYLTDEDRRAFTLAENRLAQLPEQPELFLRELLRRDFGAFLRKAWPYITGGEPIAWNWHLSAIAHELDRVSYAGAEAVHHITSDVVKLHPQCIDRSDGSLASVRGRRMAAE